MPESPQPPRPRTPLPPVPPPGAEAPRSAGPPQSTAPGSAGDADDPPPPPPPRAGSSPDLPPPGGTPHEGAQHVEAPGLDDRERTLDPRVVQVWRITTTIALLVPLVPASVIATVVLGRLGLLVPLAALGLLVLFAGWYPRARWERWRWQLTPRALELSYGVVVRTHEAVPYFRIQQIDVAQGPLDRLLDLATLQVTTASASGSASLPGVPAAQAPLVRAELLARASQAVSQHEGDVRDAV